MKFISNNYSIQRGEALSESTQSIRNQRRPRGYVSSIATNLIHPRNPWVTACWAAAFPGFGHIILGSYVKGFLLIIWEIVINLFSRANLAICMAEVCEQRASS
jgi:hypothetical protein